MHTNFIVIIIEGMYMYKNHAQTLFGKWMFNASENSWSILAYWNSVNNLCPPGVFQMCFYLQIQIFFQLSGNSGRIMWCRELAHNIFKINQIDFIHDHYATKLKWPVSNDCLHVKVFMKLFYVLFAWGEVHTWYFAWPCYQIGVGKFRVSFSIFRVKWKPTNSPWFWFMKFLVEFCFQYIIWKLRIFFIFLLRNILGFSCKKNNLMGNEVKGALELIIGLSSKRVNLGQDIEFHYLDGWQVCMARGKWQMCHLLSLQMPSFLSEGFSLCWYSLMSSPSSSISLDSPSFRFFMQLSTPLLFHQFLPPHPFTTEIFQFLILFSDNFSFYLLLSPSSSLINPSHKPFTHFFCLCEIARKGVWVCLLILPAEFLLSPSFYLSCPFCYACQSDGLVNINQGWGWWWKCSI